MIGFPGGVTIQQNKNLKTLGGAINPWNSGSRRYHFEGGLVVSANPSLVVIAALTSIGYATCVLQCFGVSASSHIVCL